MWKKFPDTHEGEILFEVALADISGNSNVNLDELAQNAINKYQEKFKRFRLMGSCFVPVNAQGELL